MAGVLSSLLQVVLPKKKASPTGTSFTSTYNPYGKGTWLPQPGYDEHRTDIFASRRDQNSLQLLKDQFRQDPDISAAVNAYLTVADTDLMMYVYDQNNQLDHVGQQTLDALVVALTTRLDYSTGFRLVKSLDAITAEMRYMLLLRGGIANELVMDKLLRPTEIRHVDASTLLWLEDTPGVYYPKQRTPRGGQIIDLSGLPTFFTVFYRKDPTDIYSYSPFVAAINTIAARQQVINDLYRIMQKTGYPRLDVKVVEATLRANAPAPMLQDENEMRKWLAARLAEISAAVTSLRPDQAFAHFDSVEADVLNKGGPAQALNVTAVIDVLNAQNQAALKTMATVIGRGESGVNTASVEAAIFAKNAEQLNKPVADMLSQIFTLAMRLTGYPGRVEASFKRVELRPDMELEPQLLIKQGRLLQQLSLGLITDDEFHMEMNGRIRPDDVPELQGTHFLDAIQPDLASPGGATTSPGGAGGTTKPAGSVKKAVTAPGGNMHKSNALKKSP